MLLRRTILTVAFSLGLAVPALVAQEAADPLKDFDTKPVPTRTPPPEVPRELEGTSGIVSLIVTIDEQGNVVEADVSKATNAAFEQPSLAAVKRWKFKPAQKAGQPVKSRVTIPLRFDKAG